MLMRYRATTSVAAFAFVLVGASAAAAQASPQAQQQAGVPADAAAPQPAADPGDAPASQDIVVTAQKRSQRLQDIPLDVQAFTSTALAQRGIDDVSKLTKASPGVLISGYSSSKPVIYVRGIGTRQLGPGTDQSVGVFLDDVYVGDASQILNGLSDIQQIEVLKGPQGTLYGRNTIAGAINITSKDPTSTLSGSAEASGGNLGYYDLRASVSGPLAGEQLTGRLSVYRTQRDGLIRNTLGDDSAPGIDAVGFRAKLVYHATDALKLTLIGDYNHDQGAGQRGKDQGPGTYLKAPAIPNPPLTSDPESGAYNVAPINLNWNYGLVFRGDYDAPGATFTSITAYRRGHVDEHYDLDQSPLPVAEAFGLQHTSNISEEFRITSKRGGALTFGDHFEWIGGLFYYRDRSDVTNSYLFQSASFPYLLAKANVFDTTNATVRTDSFAAFAQGTAHLTGSLDLTVGLRYTHDRRNGIESAGTDHPGVPVVAAPFSIPVHFAATSLDPRVTLSYKFAPAVLGYVTYTSGYKSGGFQYVATTPAIAASVFGPERVHYYEAGLKTQFFDRRLTLNLSLFEGDYRDLQLQGFQGTSLVTENVGKVTNRGIELGGQALLTNDLSVDYGYTYLDNNYDSYNQCAAAVAGATCYDFSGTRAVRSPRNQFNIGAQNTFHLGQDRLTLRGDVHYTDSYLLEPGGYGARTAAGVQLATLNPLLVEGGYTLLDLRVTYERARWSLQAFVTNATDHHYAITAAYYPPTTTALGQIANEMTRYYAEPRRFGVKLGYRF